MRFIDFFIIVLVVIAFPISSPAGEKSGGHSEFENLDRNADGYVEINEAQGELELLRDWVNVDRNEDGQLSVSEFSAFETEDDSADQFVPAIDEDEPEPGAAPH
jgi:hypothetical protein